MNRIIVIEFVTLDGAIEGQRLCTDTGGGDLQLVSVQHGGGVALPRYERAA